VVTSVISASAPLASTMPAGAPNCAKLVVKPRCFGAAHSPAISTDPLHSPPTLSPCRTRPIVSSTAPQMPITSYDGISPMPTVAIPIIIMVMMRSAFRPTRSPKWPKSTAPSGRATNPTK
jgi:hypothetical protein